MSAYQLLSPADRTLFAAATGDTLTAGDTSLGAMQGPNGGPVRNMEAANAFASMLMTVNAGGDNLTPSSFEQAAAAYAEQAGAIDPTIIERGIAYLQEHTGPSQQGALDRSV